jgi:hypothetical protein
MSLSRRRAAAVVSVPQSRSESRSVGKDETTMSAKTKAAAQGWTSRPPYFFFRGFFGFLSVCKLIRLVDDLASFHNDRGAMFLQPSNIGGVVGRFDLFGNYSVCPF